MSTLFGCTCRLASSPSITRRSISTVQRTFPRVPAPRPPYNDVESLLKASPRTSAFLDKLNSELSKEGASNPWDSLFSPGSLANGDKLDSMGLAVRERRYLLWYLEKFRQGGDPKEYDVKLEPSKKKVRGWGPKIQNGKRVR